MRHDKSVEQRTRGAGPVRAWAWEKIKSILRLVWRIVTLPSRLIDWGYQKLEPIRERITQLTIERSRKGKSFRFLVLILVVLVEVWLIYYYWKSIHNFLDSIKDFNLNVVISGIVGAPVAYLIWHWRDSNKRIELANARRVASLGCKRW